MLRAACQDSQIESKQQPSGLYGGASGLGSTVAPSSTNEHVAKRSNTLWWALTIAFLGVLAAAFGAKEYLNKGNLFEALPAGTGSDQPILQGSTAPTDLAPNDEAPVAEDTPAIPPDSETQSLAHVQYPLLAQLGIARMDYELQLKGLDVSGWQPAGELYAQAQEVVAQIKDETNSAQATQFYLQAIAELVQAEQSYNAAAEDCENRLVQAKDIIANHVWCAQCPDIQSAIKDLALQLAAIEAVYGSEQITETALTLDGVFASIGDLKIQNGSAIIEYQNRQRQSLVTSVNASEEAFARAAEHYAKLQELKSAEPKPGESTLATRMISRQAELCMSTLEARGGGSTRCRPRWMSCAGWPINPPRHLTQI